MENCTGHCSSSRQEWHFWCCSTRSIVSTLMIKLGISHPTMTTSSPSNHNPYIPISATPTQPLIIRHMVSHTRTYASHGSPQFESRKPSLNSPPASPPSWTRPRPSLVNRPLASHARPLALCNARTRPVDNPYVPKDMSGQVTHHCGVHRSNRCLCLQLSLRVCHDQLSRTTNFRGWLHL